jgi:hypothetical protein
MKAEVYAEEKNRLLNVNETDYVDYLVGRYSIEPLVIHIDQIHVSDREEMVHAGQHPFEFDVRPGARYRRQVIKYNVPYSGDVALLRTTPSSAIIWTTEVEIDHDEISFDIVNWRDDAEEIKRAADQIVRNISTQAENIANEVNQYNSQLRDKAAEIVKARKQQHLKQSNVLEGLGVPVKKRTDVPETFAIPARVKRPVVKKPTSSTTPHVPDPTLDVEIYQQILKICIDTGVEIERHPGIYQGKDEEILRDHFLMVLAPHFESVTGETFNKQGKTDILIRHEGKNAFIAECKFWKGGRAHHKTIDQILNYLTWRDSKAAILYFVANKQLEPVLQQIVELTPEHPCFVRYDGAAGQGRYNFQLHLVGDETRGVNLAILCFHFPPR